MNGERVLRLVILAASVAMLVMSFSFPPGARTVPLAMSALVAALTLLLFVQDVLAVARARDTAAAPHRPATADLPVADGLPENRSALIAEQLVEAAAEQAEDETAGDGGRKRLVLILLTALYPFVSLVVGFTIGTFVFLVAALLYLRVPAWRAALVAAVTAVVVFLFFDQLLQAPITGGLLVPVL